MALTPNLNNELEVGGSNTPPTISSGITRRLGLRIAKITSVNTSANTVDVEWIWPQQGTASGIEISSPFIGLRSGMRFVPEVNSVVVMGFSGPKPLMLSYLLPAPYENMINSSDDSTGTRTKIRELNPGEMYMASSDDAQVFVGQTVELSDQDNNSISIDPSDDSVNVDAFNFYVDTEAGRFSSGQVFRQVNGSVQLITNDGQPVTSINGGTALNEVTFKIKEFSDSTTLNDDSTSPNIMEITMGTLVSDGGLKVVNQAGNQIVCDIRLASGARIQFDKSGNYNINDGNMLLPTATAPAVDSLSVQGANTSYLGYSQQRAAREGDRISTPMSFVSKNDTAHPNMNAKVLFNVQQLQLLASMFMTPYGPCTFTPTQQDVHLLGEIVQGANGVFVGSLDKQAESQEYQNNQ